MTITLLSLMEANGNINGIKNRGLSENKIKALEKKHNKGNPFPIVMREFLFLAGEYCYGMFDFWPDIDSLQTTAKAELESLNQHIDRPIFVFDSHNDCESFSFIFLDEDVDDPKTYVYYGHFLHYGHELFEHNNFTFKSLVEESIDRLLKGYSL